MDWQHQRRRGQYAAHKLAEEGQTAKGIIICPAPQKSLIVNAQREFKLIPS